MGMQDVRVFDADLSVYIVRCLMPKVPVSNIRTGLPSQHLRFLASYPIFFFSSGLGARPDQ